VCSGDSTNRECRRSKRVARIEEAAGIGAAKELLAPGTGANAEQSESVLQSIQFELVASKYLL
jgi:hypothetical protein